LTLVRQLAELTLVAVVLTLRALELLYRVNADVDVPALLDVLIELRQFADTTELADDDTAAPRPAPPPLRLSSAPVAPLRVLFGDTARSERL
jgi:hypothetical protein